MSKIRLYGATSGYVDLAAPDVAPDGVLTLPATGALGGLVAVQSALFTGTQSASVTTGDNLSVTDLSITHEVADAANKLVISLTVLGATSKNDGTVGIAVHDGTSLIGVGDAAGSRVPVTVGGKTTTSSFNRIVNSLSATFVHTPGSGSKTYTARLVNVTDATYTLYVNRHTLDADDALSPRGASSLVIQEVSV